MVQPPSILLLDDGELNEVASLLAHLELPFTRLRGGENDDQMSPPRDLLIATPRRAPLVRRGSPPGARNGRPVRIIAVREDSAAMRRMLRRMGYHLLVRLPAHESVWKLLIRRAIYQGDERRSDSRVAVGSHVSLSGGREQQNAVLMDISNRGCRLLSCAPFQLESELTLELPPKTTGSRGLRLSGRLVRVAGNASEDGALRHSAAMVFNVDEMDDAQCTRLAGVINRWSMGPDSIIKPEDSQLSLPPRRSSAIPGLMLDDETDPSIRVGEEVGVRLHDAAVETAGMLDPAGSERRAHARSAFSNPVVALAESHSRVLMGRDLSAGGMRVERLADLHVGDRFRLAIYGPSQNDPFLLSAVVARDDGDEGLALLFEDVDPGVAEALEKLVACLPSVESLEEGEMRGLGAVLSEILDDRWRLR